MNLTETIHARYLRADCWLLGLTDTQTEKVVAHLPAWGYEKCLLFAKSIGEYNAGRTSGAEEFLSSGRGAFVEPPMEPLSRRESLTIIALLAFATGVLLAAVWCGLSKL